MVPDPYNMPPGCPFHPRCNFAHEACLVDPPWIEVEAGHFVRCVLFADRGMDHEAKGEG
jgi:peptide/nickel transport system ATP-binding protein